MAADRAAVLGLYRKLLRQAAVWPSVKRGTVIEEIKLAFRENAAASGDHKARLLEEARSGLDMLQRQSAARHGSSFSFR